MLPLFIDHLVYQTQMTDTAQYNLQLYESVENLYHLINNKAVVHYF